MSVFKRAGSPYYRYDLVFEGRRFQGSTKLRNVKAAQRAEDILRAKLAERRAGIAERKPMPLLNGFGKQFLERVKPEIRPNTWRGYATSLRVLEPSFGSKRLDEISADEIERYKQTRMERGLSPCTVNRELACLRRILLFAVRLDVLATTPFVAHKVKFLRENRRERILSFEEERKYLAAASQPLHDVAVLMLEVGLRPGEVCGIRREDVHLFAASPFLHIPAGKTANAVRDVPLTERAQEVLRCRLADVKGGFLFPLRIGNGHDEGRPMNELEPAHARALKESGIRPPFRIYDMRHTYGTRAVEGGTDPLTLMRLMGHADLKTTARYVHLSKAHLADAQKRIERYRVEQEIIEAQAHPSVQVGVQ